MNEENKKRYALTGEDMIRLNPDSKLITYDELNKVFNIDDLFRNTKKLIILYLLRSKNSGHWTCLFINEKTKGYEYFDSYGRAEDEQLDRLSIMERIEYNEQQDRLRLLLKNKLVIYNNVVLQGPGTKTCGCHTTFRLHTTHKTLKEYIDFFLKNNIKDVDDYVASYCLKLFNKLK